MVLGIDGADPATIDLLMAEGKLPNFARLRQQGAYGPLRSAEPLLSPVIWTTIATGKTPDQHQIGHFVAVNPTTGEQLPVTSQMRRVKALWNILSAAGRSTDVVGWWATWPAETIRGAIVSDHLAYHFLLEDGLKQTDAPGTTFPKALEATVRPLARKPQDVGREEIAAFVDVPAEEFARPFRFEDDLSHFRWAYAAAQSYTRIGLHLWKTERPDNLLVYVEGLDSTSHLFGHLFRVGESLGRARGTAEALRARRRADVPLRGPPRGRVSRRDGPAHDARRALGPRLRARSPPRRPQQDARHAAREREVSPARRHPVPLRPPRPAPHAPGGADDPRRRADRPGLERRRQGLGHAGTRSDRGPGSHRAASRGDLGDRSGRARSRRRRRPTRRWIPRS